MVSLGCEALGHIVFIAADSILAAAALADQRTAGSEPTGMLPQKRRPSLHDAAQHAIRCCAHRLQADFDCAAAVPV